MRTRLCRLTALALALVGLAGCGGSDRSQAGAAVAAETPPVSAAGHGHGRNERPLPGFEGRLLDGERKSISSYIGKRLVLFLFNPKVESAGAVADAVAPIAAQAAQENFHVVGVALASTPDEASAFLREHELDIPAFDDASASIAARLGLRSPVVLLGIDSEGFLDFGMASFPDDAEETVAAVEAQLRERLRLPAPSASVGALDQRPVAPAFEAPRLDGGEPFRLADRAGKPVVLLFFLHTCPHCHEALRFFKDALDKLPEDKRPELVGISIRNRPTAVRAMLRDEGLDYFPVLLDPDGSVQQAYGVFGSVPDIMMVASDGRIVRRIRGWDEKRDPPLARMVLARIAGAQVPMLLSRKGYTGNDVCSVCHEPAHQTWEFTSHAHAFDTLVTHGEDRNPECVGCHVVGWKQTGGWTLDDRQPHLEGVGCESCHGRGGPHLDPNAPRGADVDYQSQCLGCHNPEHSLGFEFATFQPRISHRAVAALGPAEREAMIADRGKPRDLLASDMEIVGSEACKQCHEAEYATWAASPHAHAVKTLESKDKASDVECLRCHTTGYGRPGGFPEQAAHAEHPDLARVGCESCHGPGAAHVAEGTRKLGSIVSLGDKCDSCVILQICGSCHDEANDPGFRFEVEARIEAQRHGTIEAGTGKPHDEQARRDLPVEAAVAQALELLEERGS